MGLTRKNLMVDAEQLRELARRRGMSESAVVRDVVARELAADDIMDALQKLHDMNAFADFEKLYSRDDIPVIDIDEKDAPTEPLDWDSAA